MGVRWCDGGEVGGEVVNSMLQLFNSHLNEIILM